MHQWKINQSNVCLFCHKKPRNHSSFRNTCLIYNLSKPETNHQTGSFQNISKLNSKSQINYIKVYETAFFHPKGVIYLSFRTVLQTSTKVEVRTSCVFAFSCLIHFSRFHGLFTLRAMQRRPRQNQNRDVYVSQASKHKIS